MKSTSVAIGIALLSIVACNDRRQAGSAAVPANAPPAEIQAPASAPTEADRTFVTDLAIANMAEVDLGKLAVERGSSAAVKKFGQMMVDEHTEAQYKLEQLAQSQNIPLPSTIDDKHRDLQNKLASLRGPDFDRAYADAMIDGHENVLGTLESRIDGAVLADWKAKFGDAVNHDAADSRQPPPVTAERSDNPTTMAVNQWAAEAYPTVFKHTESAKTLNGTVKGARASH